MIDPFAMGLFGGLPKTETGHASLSTNGTIPPINTRMGENVRSSSGQGKQSRCEPKRVTLSSSGESSSMTVDSKASTAPSSETKASTYRLSLSDRLTQSLIMSGLVKGITPSSTRKQSGQPILVLALDTPVGADAAPPRAGCSYSNIEDAA